MALADTLGAIGKLLNIGEAQAHDDDGLAHEIHWCGAR